MFVFWFGWRYVDIQIVCLREMVTKVSMASGVKLSMPKPLIFSFHFKFKDATIHELLVGELVILYLFPIQCHALDVNTLRRFVGC